MKRTASRMYSPVEVRLHIPQRPLLYPLQDAHLSALIQLDVRNPAPSFLTNAQSPFSVFKKNFMLARGKQLRLNVVRNI